MRSREVFAIRPQGVGIDVRNNNVGTKLLDPFQRRHAVRRLVQLIPLVRQRPPDPVAGRLFVIDNQDLRRILQGLFLSLSHAPKGAKINPVGLPVDADKVRCIFRRIVEGQIEVHEFEAICSKLSYEELLLLRELAMQARCATITILAERGFPNLTSRPN